VSELFNKPFELFENNRELLDNLAYILCQETIYDFEIEDYYSSHFINTRKSIKSINYGSNIHLHFVTSLKF
jgi:hypothetical protein